MGQTGYVSRGMRLTSCTAAPRKKSGLAAPLTAALSLVRSKGGNAASPASDPATSDALSPLRCSCSSCTPHTKLPQGPEQADNPKTPLHNNGFKQSVPCIIFQLSG